MKKNFSVMVLLLGMSSALAGGVQGPRPVNRVQVTPIRSAAPAVKKPAVITAPATKNTSRPASSIAAPATKKPVIIDTQTLYNRILTANGINAISNVNYITYDASYYDGSTKLEFLESTVIDLKNRKLVTTASQNDQIVAKLLFDGKKSYLLEGNSYNELAPEESKTFERYFQTGLLGLSSLQQNNAQLLSLGEQTWLNVQGRSLKGNVLQVKVPRQPVELLMTDASGCIIAARQSDKNLLDLIAVFSQHETVNGILVPKMASFFSPDGKLLQVLKTNSYMVNPQVDPMIFNLK